MTICYFPGLAALATTQSTMLPIQFAGSTKVNPTGIRYAIFSKRRIMSPQTSGLEPMRKESINLPTLFALRIVRVQLWFNQLQEVNLECFNILLKRPNSLNLVNLIKIHLVLCHCVPTLQHPLLALIIIDSLRNWPVLPVFLKLNRTAVGLILLQDLLAC